MTTPIRSTCPYCGVGCGVLLTPQADGGLKVEGDPEHPANLGRLCSKGLALGDTVGLEGRLLTPQVDGTPASWDKALDLVADRFTSTIAEHGPDSVAFYVSGQLLTEDYYVANKLMKGFMGSANIDTNSRLCMASTVAGHKRAFGTDTVPGVYEDLEIADLVVLVGSNLAWCHPVLYQRLAAARAAHGTKVVVVDPRRTSSCDIADLHLKIAPGSDAALFNGLLTHLASSGEIDTDFVSKNVTGFDAALASARADDPSVTGVSDADLTRFYEMFAATDKVVTVFSQGINQSSSGTDKVNAIINCHLASGRIGLPGSGPFSVTGQPNAMGGRETGGLANMLAAHLDLENAEHREAVQTFWDAPTIPTEAGLKAVDLFDAVESGQIKALWIACTNPVVSMPDSDRVAQAIAACDFTVVSDLNAQTDTARLADVVLPALGWGEKSGTVTNSDRTISRQRSALKHPGQARADWDIFADVGRRMGWEAAFDYQSEADIFREHAQLSRIAGDFGKDFDISALSDLSDADYDAFAPQRWPISDTANGGRFFADGAFFTPTGRANMLPIASRAPEAKLDQQFPLRLNSGRARDQWHTMSRTGLSAKLCKHLAEPFLQIHPEDALACGVASADLALVTGRSGEAIFRVWVTDDVAKGAPFAPIHWTGETAAASVVARVIPAITDPVSGQPESKSAAVSVTKFEAAWYAFAVSAIPLQPTTPYWSRVPVENGLRAELAGLDSVQDWASYAKELFGIESDPMMVTDTVAGQTRLAFYEGDALMAALYVGREPVAVARDFIAAQIGQQAQTVLAARPGKDVRDPGPTVCSCMSVGRNQILDAIPANGTASVEFICQSTGAGTNCGSCRSEIAQLIARPRQPIAAE
ncbi:nitrate reductase [Cognatishimia maritima]|uniref:Assimilatory nitrate reductase (NADH) alpha subunit apoprotein n=1 Tax=Cognatishimia maritima TaxID=870908 RepID=A0A1M5PN94_9RHOB|nr:nitrate reductase [Cognatishimia maritima]SHH03224.1 assimilatory nitrate reductase (NADH) alpha subunit apoprotein [Cognatishimia maritima]